MSSIAGRREALDSVAFRCLPFFIHRYKKNPLQVLTTNGFAFPQRKERKSACYSSSVRIVPAGIECVTHVLPPIVLPRPITVLPPSIVAPA